MRGWRFIVLLTVLGAGLLWCPVSFAEVKDMEIVRQTEGLEIRAHYPVLNIPAVDAALVRWAENVVNAFEEDFGTAERLPSGAKYLFNMEYSVDAPSDRAISITFEVETYTGGAHGALDIIVLTYDTQTGLALSLPFFFEDVEMALNLMATASYEALSAKLGPEKVEDMLRGGTSPDADNYSALALRPGGVRIHFQPYQVAPWAAGPQYVDMPLEALADARPQWEWWGRIGE